MLSCLHEIELATYSGYLIDRSRRFYSTVSSTSSNVTCP